MGLEYGAKSGGVFDITINPLLKLWGFGTGNPHLPDAKDIEEAKKLVNYRDVIVDDQNSTVLLRRTGMSIDLGGVAKGFIVAEATNVLKSYGINHAIVDAGGDLYILGFKPKKYPWGKNEPYRVGLQDPNANTGTGILGVVSMPPGAVVTSGDYERYFEVNGVRYHHIIDPRTGYPAKGLTSVTIKTSDPAMADLVATAAMVLGPEEGKKLVNEWPGIDAILITSGTMTQYVSPGMQAIYTPLSSEQ
jgi:thiamine biosynthesis lipoprotein